MLRLRESISEDIEIAYALHEPGLRDFLFPGSPSTRNQVREWYEDVHPCCYTVLDGDMPLGLVWFSGFDGTSAYVTVGLTSPGKGIGTELAPLVAKHAFERHAFHRLATTVVEDNMPALRIAAAFGEREGILREAFRDSCGKHHNVYVFSLLRSEWKR